MLGVRCSGKKCWIRVGRSDSRAQLLFRAVFATWLVLGSCPPTAADELGQLLSSCDPESAESLAQLAGKLDRLAADSSGEEAKRRAFVSAALGKLTNDTPVAIQVLLIEQVGGLGKYEAVRPLGKILADESADPLVRESTRRALEAIPVVTVKKALRDALGKASGTLRIGILRSLGTRRDSLAVQHMLEAAEDDDVEVRLAAIEAMALVGEISSVGTVEKALGRYEGVALLRVRRAYLRLADSLVENSERGTARRIYDRAMSLGTAESCAALIGFARAGLQSEVQRIVGLTASEDPELRGAALEAAAILPGPNMTKALRAAFEKAEDEAVRRSLEEVLARREAKTKKP